MLAERLFSGSGRNWNTLMPNAVNVPHAQNPAELPLTSPSPEKNSDTWLSACFLLYFPQPPYTLGVLGAVVELYKHLKSGTINHPFKDEDGLPWWPVAKTLRFHCRGMGLIPGPGSSTSCSAAKKEKKKKKKNEDDEETVALGLDTF